MIAVELEQAIDDTIDRYVTEENKDEILLYFEDTLITSMVERHFE